MKTQIKLFLVSLVSVMLFGNLYASQIDKAQFSNIFELGIPASQKYIKPSVNISYLAESFKESSKPKSNFWITIAKLFNLDNDAKQQKDNISFEITLDESAYNLQVKNIAITAQKVIFQW